MSYAKNGKYLSDMVDRIEADEIREIRDTLEIIRISNRNKSQVTRDMQIDRELPAIIRLAMDDVNPEVGIKYHDLRSNIALLTGIDFSIEHLERIENDEGDKLLLTKRLKCEQYAKRYILNETHYN